MLMLKEHQELLTQQQIIQHQMTSKVALVNSKMDRELINRALSQLK
jgi:hypothetical protein